ncbi:MAG: tetratricopeptide repeat protein [Myxococcales bacterium]|nr:tetratricopeptide repeat protein [Myxococcales bacterium]
MSFRTASTAAALAALLALTGACKPPARTTEAPFDADAAKARAAALERHLKQSPGDAAATRELAHLFWLHLRSPHKAAPLLDRLAAEDDPVAQVSRMLMADARLELATVRTMAQALVRGAARKDVAAVDRPTIDGLAELAARYIAENHGELPDDDSNFPKFFETLDLDALPAQVGHTLLSLRASIARRYDQPYLGYYDRQGCVRAWSVGQLEGTLAAFELRRAAADPNAFTADPEALLTPLSCVVRVWNPLPRAGMRRMRTFVDVPGGALRLQIGSQEPIRVYVDGAPVYRNDLSERWPSGETTLELKVAPGTHRVDVHAAVPRDKVWVMLRATDLAGKPLTAGAAEKPLAAAYTDKPRQPASPFFPYDRGPLAGPAYKPLRMLLAATDAMADGDTDNAEGFTRALVHAGPAFAEGYLVVAAFEIGDPTRERAASTTRQRSAIETGLSLDPGLTRARVRLLELGLERGESAEVLDAIEELGDEALRDVSGELLRYAAYTARGNEQLADAALTRAAAIHPDHCAVLKAQRGVAQRRGDVAREDALTAKVERCPGTTGTRARLAARRGKFDEARALFQKLIERTPDDVEVMAELADIAIAEGKLDEALALRRKILALNPYNARMLLGIADLQARKGDVEAARASVEVALTRVPHSLELAQIARAVGVPDDMAPLRVAGMPLIEAYRKQNTEYEGVAEVLVLDRSATRVYPDGSQRHIVHTIAELRSKEAIDRYGEIEPAEGSQVLTLHTIKPDGRVFEPESIPEKDGLSLRGLQIGDFVEYEYMLERPAMGLLPGYVDLSTFRFQSQETPFHVSEMIVAAPPELPLKAELRGGAPAAVVTKKDGLVISHWRVERSPRLGVEPQMRNSLYEVPSVRVYTDVSVDAWLAALGLRLYTTPRSNLELRQLTRRLIAGEKTARGKLEKLHRWVVENVEEVGEMQIPATLTLSARKGGGMMLLKAMLREAGVRAELWVARDSYGLDIKPGGNPLYESFDSPYLAVWTGEGADPVMVVTGSKVVPIGFLLPGLSRARAMRVPVGEGDPPGGEVEFPEAPAALASRRSYKFNVDLKRDGTGSVKGTIDLQGMEAAAWRDALRNVDRDRVNEGFERAELAVLFPGATVDLEELEIHNEKDLGVPLQLEFSGTIRGMIVNQGGELLMRASVVPLNVGLGYTSLPQRKTGYVIPYAPLLDAHVTIKLAGGRFTGLPSAEKITTPHGTYTRSVESTAGAEQITVHTTATLQTGVYGPEKYPGLAGLTRQVKAAEDQIIRAK